MGRIFEVRKHAMFARWNRMAKQFARIGKDITIAVKSGGTDPNSNSRLRRVMQNARAVNMPKDKVESAIRRASGKEAANYDVNYLRRLCAAWRRGARRNRDRQPDAHGRAACATSSAKHGGNLATSNSVSFMFKKMGVFRLNPEGIDQDDLELYLIDHGLEEMGESTGEKGEPQIVIRCAFADFGHVQKALEDRSITPLSAEHEYICLTPTELPEAASDRSAGADRQAGTGRGRAEGLSHAGVSWCRAKARQAASSPPGSRASRRGTSCPTRAPGLRSPAGVTRCCRRAARNRCDAEPCATGMRRDRMLGRSVPGRRTHSLPTATSCSRAGPLPPNATARMQSCLPRRFRLRHSPLSRSHCVTHSCRRESTCDDVSAAATRVASSRRHPRGRSLSPLRPTPRAPLPRSSQAARSAVPVVVPSAESYRSAPSAAA